MCGIRCMPGTCLTHVAFLLVNPTVWNLGVYLACYACAGARLLAEERLLARRSAVRGIHDIRFVIASFPECFERRMPLNSLVCSSGD